MRKRIIAACVFLTVAAAPSHATTMRPVDVVCPVGGETFKSFEIMSTSSFGMRLDGQQLGPAAYLPYVECPNGFIVYKDQKEFTPEEIAKLTPIVASDAYQFARVTEMPAFRVIMLRHALGEGDVDLRGWYFKAAFEAENHENDALRQKYLALAADAYDGYLKTHTARDEEWWFSSLRRADIGRQLGRFDEAAAAVRALEAAHGSEDPICLKVAAQILRRAQAHDAAPAEYQSDGG